MLEAKTISLLLLGFLVMSLVFYILILRHQDYFIFLIIMFFHAKNKSQR
jgi:hypothetical protein